MSPQKKSDQRNKFNYFDYDLIIGIDFGGVNTNHSIFLTKEGRIRSHTSHAELSACPYSCKNNDYDNATLEGWTYTTEDKKNALPNAFYIDNLLDEVEYLFNTEPDVEKPLKEALDRLRKRAVNLYFNEIITYINKTISESGGKSVEIRYVIPYPSDWIPEKAAYLRSLVQMTDIVSEYDHPDRLIMCNVGEAIFCYLQQPYKLGTQIKQGQKYIICDMGSSKVKMSLYNIEEPLEKDEDINRPSRCDWNSAFGEQHSQLNVSARDLLKQVEKYVLSRLSTESREVSLEDFYHKDGVLYNQREEFSKLTKEIIIDIKIYGNEKIKANKSYYFTLPFSIQAHQFVSITPENMNSSISSNEIPCLTDGQMSIEKTRFEFCAREIEERVIVPFCKKVISYIEEILQAASVSIDGIIFVGDLSNNNYLIELIAEACKRAGVKFIKEKFGVEEGAILKVITEVGAREFKPEIVFDNWSSPLYSQPCLTRDIFVFIDYGLEKTRISYIDAPSGDIANSANLKHITDWPGQPSTNLDLSTLDVMLIQSTKQVDRYSDKRIISIENCSNHYSQYLKYTEKKYTEYEYYTFEKDEQGITLLIHRSSKVEKEPNEGEVDQDYIDKYGIIVTRKRISAQEFTLLYFDHLAAFIYDYVKSKNSDRFRFCITRDSQAHPKELTLSDDDIYNIAHECNMISRDSPNTLLVLEREQATAIHCRTMIDTSTVKRGESYLHFLQVHLHPDRCLLVLNDAPLPDNIENSINRENGKPWESICKYPKTKSIPVDIMDIIAENLWSHIQKYQYSLLQKCKRHEAPKKFFNLSNMQIFKKLLHVYISKKTLDIENCELEQEIIICDSDNTRYCILRIANMDLLEFGIVSAINQLASIIQASASNKDFFQSKRISDIFVMGEFLECQDHTSYSFLERLLLTKISKIKFYRSDNLALNNLKRKTRVTKINGQEKLQERPVNNNSIEVTSMNGSILYSLDPRNRLVERFADRTYAITNQLPTNMSRRDEPTILIQKGVPLASFTPPSPPFRNECFFRCSRPDFFLDMYLCTAVSGNLEAIDRNRTRHRVSKFTPIIEAHLSQSGSYQFWVEYGVNEKECFRPLKERIMLKSFYRYK